MHAQTNTRDSLLQVAKQKRIQDSIARVALKERNIQQRDSLVQARTAKRIADSLQRVQAKLQLLQQKKNSDSLKKVMLQRTQDSLRLDRERVQRERNEQIQLSKAKALSEKQKLDSALQARNTNNENALQLAPDKKSISKSQEENEKRIKDSLAQVTRLEKDAIKQRERTQADSIKLVKQQAKEQQEAAEKALALEAKLRKKTEEKTKDSLAAIQKQQEETLALEAKLRKQAEQKTKDSLAAIQKQQEEAITLKAKLRKQAEQKTKDSLANIQKQQEEAIALEAKLRKHAEQKTKDSLTAIQKQQEEALALEAKLRKQVEQKTKDSLAAIQKQQEEALALEAKLRKQAEQKTKDSLANIQQQQEEALALEAKRRKQTEQKTKDSLDAIQKQQEEALALEAKLRKQAEQKTKDSLATIQKQQEEAIAFEAKLRKQAEQKTNNSLTAIQKQQEEALVREAAWREEQAQKAAAEQNLNDNDSVRAEKERLRLQALRYEKQRIEDSIYLAKSKPATATPDSLTSVEQAINTDSLQLALQKKHEDSIFMAKTLQVEKKSYYQEKNKRTHHYEQQLGKATFLSFHVGLSNYLGDLGGNSGIGKSFIYDNNLKKNTYFYGLSFSYLKKYSTGIRFSYTFGKIAGSDHDVQYTSQQDPAYNRYKRNLNFQTKISEFALMLETYPLKWFHVSSLVNKSSLQPYLVAGVGRYKFNPQGSYYDDIAEDYVWVDLAPLRTEGQGMSEYPNRKPYKLSQWNLPFGGGLRYSLGQKTSLSFEFIGRKLFTDYLDDVSTTYIDPNTFSNYLTEEDAKVAKLIANKSGDIDPDNPYQSGDVRGNAKNKDFYYSFNVRLSIQLNKKPKAPSFRKIYKYDDSEICD